MIHRFYRINENLYRGSAPTTQDVVELNDKYGINRIVSLDQMAGENISRICKLLGISHIIIPLDATKISPMVKLMSYDLDELLIDDGPTFVHCIQGKDRTGMVIAMYDCKHDGVSCDDAIKRAKKLGFGVGLPPKITKFYERAIRHYCGCPKDDDNNADIVDNERQYKSEWRDSYLDEADTKSFAPGQDIGVREFPFSPVYDYAYDPTLSTRENPDGNGAPIDLGDVGGTPMVGIYENDSGIRGAGPVEIGGGFVNNT